VDEGLARGNGTNKVWETQLAYEDSRRREECKEEVFSSLPSCH